MNAGPGVVSAQKLRPRVSKASAADSASMSNAGTTSLSFIMSGFYFLASPTSSISERNFASSRLKYSPALASP